MTEDRVPTTGPPGNLVDALMDAWQDGDTYVYTKDQMRTIIDSVRSEQPAPPLDVERLALALDDEGGAFRDRDNRRAAERILVRLGSAPSTPEARDD